jgi:ABC-type polysaccharide/polyol phosphate transport system ATPase subunit
VACDTSADANAIDGNGAGKRAAEATAEQIAIEVRGVEKVFRIPAHRISRLKERLARPLARQEYRRLEALRDVSFDVHRGEFFGIVGRNGSGKSTLLKIMASIYRADGGRVRMAGSLAPFIELGVGFDMELSARENVVLNGVMMGLTPKEARYRLDQVLEFAELKDFVEVKLKNYSSGMLVRLGFSVMIQADTDTLLIDEVLAVGDAAFQQKCADVFRGMRDKGKTIVLVTHDMSAIEGYCHRAMLLSKGRIAQIGDSGEVARRYLRLNFEQGFEPAKGEIEDVDSDVRVLDIWIEDADGKRVTNVEQGTEMRVRSLLEARRKLPDPMFSFVVADVDEVMVHEFVAPLSNSSKPEALSAGERVKVSVNVENRLTPGRYYIHHGIGRSRAPGDSALWVPHALGFVVFGDQHSAGLVAPEHRMDVTKEAGEAP